MTGPTGLTGPQGPPATVAYAVINPAKVTTTPSAEGLVGAQSSGFQSVRSPSAGIYCLTPSPGIDPSKVPATVTGEVSYSTGGVAPLAALNAQRSDCMQGEFEVVTYDTVAIANGKPPSATPAGGVAFAIMVP